MSRKLFIAGNWKLNHNAAKSAEVISELAAKLDGVNTVDYAICPTFTSLEAAIKAAGGSNVKIGSQNIHWASNGAFTGEISAEMLCELGVDYAIIGHSERRQYFGETDATINQRLNAALAADLKPIVCVGETLEERQADRVEDVISTQFTGCFNEISPEDMAKVVIAYEPVWAIGTGETASPEQAQDVHALIRGLIRENYGEEIANGLRIQYGGSVKPANVVELMGQEDIDGALVGGASLTAEDFSTLILNVS
jgi:triosephosphate isomerase